MILRIYLDASRGEPDDDPVEVEYSQQAFVRAVCGMSKEERSRLADAAAVQVRAAIHEAVAFGAAVEYYREGRR
jgi:hypothetical protein